MDTLIQGGLLKFTKTQENIEILTTFSQEVWGNMNPYYSPTEEDKKRIEENDHKISNILETKLSFVFTTPPEDTIIHLNTETISYLNSINKADEQGYKYIIVRGNAAIIEPYSSNISTIFAPADCPIAIVTFPDSDISIVMHLGAPQVFEGIHIKTLKFAQSLYPSLDLSKASVYITPYICQNHYSISQERADGYIKMFRNPELLQKSMKKGTHKIFKDDRYYFDFGSILKSELQKLFGLSTFIESGYCTYEESLKGNLFSHELSQELEEGKSEEEKESVKKFKGNFNVAIGIKGKK